MLGRFGVIAEIAFRSLLASRWKTLIVGGISGFAALLVLVGSAFLDSVESGLERSISDSIAGDIQVYSAESKVELTVIGGAPADDPAPLHDFGKLRAVLEKVPNVAAIVPMGFSDAVASSQNPIDRALHALQDALSAVEEHPDDDVPRARYDAQKERVRRVTEVMRSEVEAAGRVTQGVVDEETLGLLAKVTTPSFWADFDRDRSQKLELLEQRVAPLAANADPMPLRYVGTDPAAFARAFRRMRVVDGQPIPSGERGFMFSKLVYEQQVKMKAARGLDSVKSARDERGATIAQDPELQRAIEENVNGVNAILLELDAAKTDRFRAGLQRFLGSKEADVGKLLGAFFAMDDASFEARYAFFYRELAPELPLYRVRVGDVLTLGTVTRGGYVRTANVKVYGTYVFDGLERSPQAGAVNMVDLVTFRELYGFMTPEREREIAAMRAEAGAVDVARETVEAQLFGANEPSTDEGGAKAAPAIGDQLAHLRGTRAGRARSERDSYDAQQLREGPILNAAIMLVDDTRLDDTLRAIEAAAKRADLPLKVIPGRLAAGALGQFVTLMTWVLLSAVLVIFLVALVVINNAVVMATLDRVNEIGALRAIGASRRFVLTMVVTESAGIGLIFGALGAALGSFILLALGKVGIPASNDVMNLLFSGPRLFPTLAAHHLVVAISSVVAIALVSGVYPALLAVRVTPREAMHAES